MATMFSMKKTERSKTRRLPLLPRVGLVVDVAGRTFTFKYASLLETAMNVRDRGLPLSAFRKVLTEELAEIKFSALVERGLAAVKKSPAKAAAAKKKQQPEVEVPA